MALEARVESLQKELNETKNEMKKDISEVQKDMKDLNHKMDYMISLLEKRSVGTTTTTNAPRSPPLSTKGEDSPLEIIAAKPISQVSMKEPSDDEEVGHFVVKRKRPMKRGKYQSSPFIDPNAKRPKTSDNRL